MPQCGGARRDEVYQPAVTSEIDKAVVSSRVSFGVPGMTIKHVNDASFEQDVLKSAEPVLVDYWAEWCGPCKMIAPILDEVSRDYGEKLHVAKLNVDENQAVAAKFGIRGIPTLMLFKNGAVVATKVGALSKSQLKLFLDSHL